MIDHMKLIFLYGPPASGKLTIAEKVSELTGIRLFHNHLSRDLVKDVYGDELDQHYDLVDMIRFDVLEYCSKNDTDLLFTYVYEGEEDDANVKKYIDIVESNGGEVIFFEIMADREALIERVGNDSRKRFKKLSDREIMRQITTDMSIYSIPFVESVKVNTSKLNADQSAQLVIKQIT